MPGDERATLLALQRALTEEQFQSLKFLLEGRLPLGELRPASRPDLCRLLLQHFPGQALELTAELLRHLARHDLIQRYQLPGARRDPGPAQPGTPVPPAEPGSADRPGCPGSSVPAGHPGSSMPAGFSVPPGSSLPPAAPTPPAAPAASPPPGRGADANPPRRLTEKELMQVAQKLGREWQEVGIVCLGLEGSLLEQIRADNAHSVVLQRFQMLREWRRRQRQEATAPRLLESLAQASLDPEVLDLLHSFQD